MTSTGTAPAAAAAVDLKRALIRLHADVGAGTVDLDSVRMDLAKAELVLQSVGPLLSAMYATRRRAILAQCTLIQQFMVYTVGVGDALPAKHRPGRFKQWWRLGWSNPLVGLGDLIGDLSRAADVFDIEWAESRMAKYSRLAEVVAELVIEAQLCAEVGTTLRSDLDIRLYQSGAPGDLLRRPGLVDKYVWLRGVGVLS